MRLQARALNACLLLVATLLWSRVPPALAEPAPKGLDQALADLLSLGTPTGCGSAFGIHPADTSLATLRQEHQLGPELAALCSSSATFSAGSLGGSLGSLQTTKTASQFRLLRRRVDSRLDATGKRFGLDGSLMLAAADAPLRSPVTDAIGQDPALQAGFGTFVQAEYERRERATTALEAGYDANVAGGLVGFDYAIPSGFLGGVWAGYGSTSATFAARSSVFLSGLVTSGLSDSFTPAKIVEKCHVSPGGDFDDKGAKVGGFVGGRLGGAFGDIAVQYSHRDYSYRRNTCVIEPTASVSLGNFRDDVFAGTIFGKTTLTEWNFSARVGYDFETGRFLIGPRLLITHVRTTVDPFRETGQTSVTETLRSNVGLVTERKFGDPTGLELAYDEQRRTSLQGEAQLVLAYRFEGEFGAVIPRVSAGWIHEFEGERRVVRVQMAQDFRATPARFTFTTDSLDKNKGVVAIGVAALIGRHFMADLEVARLVADDRFESTSVTVQARWRF